MQKATSAYHKPVLAKVPPLNASSTNISSETYIHSPQIFLHLAHPQANAPATRSATINSYHSIRSPAIPSPLFSGQQPAVLPWPPPSPNSNSYNTTPHPPCLPFLPRLPLTLLLFNPIQLTHFHPRLLFFLLYNMPQVYRRRSDYSHQRPSVEPRRRSTTNSTQPQPPITDSDDSIVLSDLVRAGETSRLRRRGAMRLDHPRSTLQPLPPPSDPLTSSSALPQSSSSNPLQVTATANPPSQPPFQPPSRSSSPPWAISDPTQDDPDFIYGGTEWREWSNEDTSQSSTTSLPLDDYTSPSASTSHPHNNDQPFMLFCGGEIKDTHLEYSSSSSLSSSSSSSSSSPFSKSFKPSLLPLTNHRASSCSVSSSPHHRRSVKTTNGCGAVVHMRAFPQKPRAVWVGKEEATDVVVGLDASYFERAIVAKMMKSACGCIREGIGCAVWLVPFPSLLIAEYSLLYAWIVVVILWGRDTCLVKLHQKDSFRDRPTLLLIILLLLDPPDPSDHVIGTADHPLPPLPLPLHPLHHLNIVITHKPILDHRHHHLLLDRIFMCIRFLLRMFLLRLGMDVMEVRIWGMEG